MIGLFFLGVIALWIWLIFFTSRWIVKGIRNPWIKWSSAAIIFVALLIAPMSDEIVGKRQFEALCRAGDIGSIDVSAAKGKTVVVHYGERSPVPGMWVPIKENDVIFTDASTREILIQHKNYYASGGWLRRYTFFGFGSNTPVIFGGSTCDIRKEQDIFRANSITLQYK